MYRKPKERVINLSLQEKNRWVGSLKGDLAAIRRLYDEANQECTPILVETAAEIFGLGYDFMGGLYREEMDSIALEAGIPSSVLRLLNHNYDLSQLSDYFAYKGVGPFGCTAAIVNTEMGLAHVRTLDWPLENISNATRIYRFKKGRREFVTAGIAGMVGVLSGMLPGEYSVTINWAPPSKCPQIGWSPPMLLRSVLEECDSYEEAVKVLKSAKLSCGVFFTVCGKDKACVIERTKDGSAVRKMQEGYLVQANHYSSEKFEDENDCINEWCEEDGEEWNVYADSLEREEALEDKIVELMEPSDISLRGLMQLLSDEPVTNGDTHQKMVFVPATGEFQILRYR